MSLSTVRGAGPTMGPMDVPLPFEIAHDPGVVRLLHPDAGAASTGLVLASPHSGRDYPEDFVAASRLDTRTLRQSEDSLVDELFAGAPSLGVPLLAATFPRVFCDVNRERWELDPEMFADRLPPWCNTTSPRIVAGHGTIAKIAGGGERIHRRKLRFAEACARIEACWEPYHRALGGLLEATRAREGACLLIDCHSMPQERIAAPADFVLGDNHGASCAPHIVGFVEALLRAEGYHVRRNEPYAGGFVTRTYGRPASGVHVLQLEISRALYLDERDREKGPGFETLRTRLDVLVATVARSADLIRRAAS